MNSPGNFARVKDALCPFRYGPNGVKLVVDFMEHAKIQSTEWGTREQVLHSYELVARYVMPHFQGSLESLDRSQAWSAAKRPELMALRDAASSPCVAVRHVRGCLLMPRRYELDVGLIVKCVQGVVKLHARQSEYDTHSFEAKLPGQGLTACHLWHFFL